MKTLNKALSVILIAAMVITLTPETAYKVNAAETDQTETESTESVVSTEAAVDEIIEETDVKEASGVVKVNFTQTGGQVTVDGNSTTTAGSDYSFTVAQVTGYEVTDVTVSGGATGFKTVPESGKYGVYVVDNTGTALADDITITITTAAAYDVTFKWNGNADISVNGTVLTDTTNTISFLKDSEVHFAVTPKEGYEIIGVAYTPADGKAQNAYFDEDDNTWFFTLSSATIVTVSTTEIAGSQAVFTGSNIGKVTITKRNGTALATAEELSYDSSSTTTVTDTVASRNGTEFSFKLAAADKYKIEEVYYEHEMITPDSAGVYTVTAGTTTKIEVYTERTTESYKYKLTFNLGSGISGCSASTDSGDESSWKDNVLYTDKEETRFYVTTDSGIEVDQVTAGTSSALAKEEHTDYYTYTFTPSKDGSQVSDTITVTGKVTAEGWTWERKFHFSCGNNISNLQVTTEGVTYDSDKDEYTISYQAAAGNAVPEMIDEVEFTFTAPTYEYDEPSIYSSWGMYDGECEVSKTEKDGKTTYTYKIATANMSATAEENEISVYVSKDFSFLTFKGGQPKRVSGKFVSEAASGAEEGNYSGDSWIYVLDRGTTATVTLPENKAAYQVENNVTSDDPVETDANNKFSVELKEKQVIYELKNILDYQITTDPSDLSEAVLAGKEITASVSRFDDGEAATPYKVSVSDGAASTAVINNGKVIITAAKEDAGKEVSVEIFVREVIDGKRKTASAGTVTFSVENPVTAVKYAKKSISQTVDTTVSYSLSVAPVSISANALVVEVSKELSDIGVKAEITKETASGKSAFKLNVTTGINEAKGNILIYDATVAEKDRIESKALCTIPVSVVNADLTISSVKTGKMTHYSAALSVKSKNKLNTEGSKPYYYEVKVTPAEGTEAPTRKEVTTYNYFRYEAQTQTIEVQLSDRAGSAVAWDYNIEVKLVQPSASVTDDTVDNPLENTNESAIAKKLSVTTKAPYYEDKLSVTKKTTTIYNGQSDVVAAVAKFSKNATYLKAASTAVYNTDGTSYEGTYSENEYGTINDSRITARVENAGEIIVSVGKDVSIGSYTIKVVPEYADETYAAPATFKIKVVQGIRYIDIIASSEVYKPANKAVTIKPTYWFTGITADAKTKKATYALYENLECTQELTGDLAEYVTVNKSGKITIAKGYRPAYSDNNVFYLKVSAADYEGNETTSWRSFEITDEPIEIADVYLEKLDTETLDAETPTYSRFTGTEITTADLGYCIIDTEGSEIHMYEKMRVVAVDSEGNTIDPSRLTYKSSSNVVGAYNNGYDNSLYLRKSKTAKNVTITVTTADGGKKSKKTLPFSVVYAVPESLNLTCVSGEDNNSGNEFTVTANAAGTEFSYAANSSLVKLDCYIKANDSKDDLYDAVGLCNYKVSVKGGKVLTSDSSTGKLSIQPTAKETTVTLTDKSKSTPVTKTYKFTNTNYVTTKAPSAKLYAINDDTGSKKVYVNDKVKLSYKVNSTEYEYVAVNGTPYKIDSEGKFELDNMTYYSTATYVMYMTYGHLDDQYHFVADTKTSVVKLKVNKLPTPKLVSTYKMTKVAGSTVELQIKNGTLNTEKLDFADAELLNANVKGKPNKFKDYFVLDRSTGTIKLNDELTDKDIAKISKTDMTGYITHTVYNNVTVTEKVTIKFSSK